MRTETLKITCNHCDNNLTGNLEFITIQDSMWPPARPVHHSVWVEPRRFDFCGTECLARWAFKRLGWVNTIPPEHTPDPESMY